MQSRLGTDGTFQKNHYPEVYTRQELAVKINDTDTRVHVRRREMVGDLGMVERWRGGKVTVSVHLQTRQRYTATSILVIPLSNYIIINLLMTGYV